MVIWRRLMTGLLLVAAAPACGAYDDPRYPHDKDFDRYRAFFEKHTGIHTRYIPISYSKLAAGEVANCHFTVVDGKWYDKYILVDRTLWESLDVQWKRLVLAHELIHCSLEVGHEHVDTTDPFWIMDPVLPVGFRISEELVVRQIEYYKED